MRGARSVVGGQTLRNPQTSFPFPSTGGSVQQCKDCSPLHAFPPHLAHLHQHLKALLSCHPQEAVPTR